MLYHGERYSYQVTFGKMEVSIKSSEGHSALGDGQQFNIRRLTTPSFADRRTSNHCYSTQWRWYWRNDIQKWEIYDRVCMSHKMNIFQRYFDLIYVWSRLYVWYFFQNSCVSNYQYTHIVKISQFDYYFLQVLQNATSFFSWCAIISNKIIIVNNFFNYFTNFDRIWFDIWLTLKTGGRNEKKNAQLVKWTSFSETELAKNEI